MPANTAYAFFHRAAQNMGGGMPYADVRTGQRYSVHYVGPADANGKPLESDRRGKLRPITAAQDYDLIGEVGPGKLEPISLPRHRPRALVP